MNRGSVAALGVLLLAVTTSATAQPGAGAGTGAGTTGAEQESDLVELERYLSALAQRRLIAAETGSVERLRELVRRGEDLYYEGRYDESALLLFEVAESPRFADFVENDEFRGAEYMLAGALQQLGALRSSERYLERILARGAEDPYFGPAFRRFTDVALESGDLARAVARIEALGVASLPEDAQNELLYLRARERYDAGEPAAAEPILAEITQRSRFFAPAQYFRGTIAVRAGQLDVAEEHFCSIATTGDRARASFVVDERYFEVKDLARLALGRIAHEGRRADDAFYYYFQVPADSDRVSEALFEAAYAMYEGGDFDTSIDLLDQLAARFPNSPFVDEALLLRGYVHLGRCEFEEANRLFVRFGQRFEPIRRELEAIFASPARRDRFYEDMIAQERGEGPAAGSARGVLLALMNVDPTFHRLHAQIRILDAEAARSGRVREDIDALLARVEGGDRPRRAADAEDVESDEVLLRRDVEAARAVLRSLTEQIDAMRAARAPAAQLAPLENDMREIGRRLDALETRLGELLQGAAEADAAAAGGAGGDDVTGLLRRDLGQARRFPARISAVRARLVAAANRAALRSVQALRARIGAGVRRARIGRIDAVMGSKRRIEIQIESLAAGRFPPELMDPLRIQGLLRDDEEYWPFEGEDWPDEYDQPDADDDDDDDADTDADAAQGTGGED